MGVSLQRGWSGGGSGGVGSALPSLQLVSYVTFFFFFKQNQTEMFQTFRQKAEKIHTFLKKT